MSTPKIITFGLILALIASSCSLIPGNSSGTTNVSIGPLNQNYSNALPPSEQLIIGTLKLEGTNLAVTPQESAQLVTLWEAYRSLITSNTAAPEEMNATLTQIEQSMTPDQVQAIANMKLTRQDMATVFQQQGITFGGRNGGTPEAGRTPRAGGGGGGGIFFGGGPGGGGGGGGFGGFGGATPNPQALATLQARRASGAANAGLVSVLIRFLQNKNPSLTPSGTPSPAPLEPSSTPTP